MDQETLVGRESSAPARAGRTTSITRDPSYQAFRILHAGYVAAPLLAGIDKFLGRLTDWDQYLAPPIARRSPLGRHGTMLAVGAVEIAAGVLVAARPRLGGYVVSAWLAGIIANLLIGKRSYDVALRDLGLSLGALALSRLAEANAR